jgi:hypothetical protein
MQTLMTMRNLVSLAGPPALTILQARIHQAVIDYRIGGCQQIAVLGLIMWFLMALPLVNEPWKIDTEAPLPQWQTVSTFQAESEWDETLLSVDDRYKSTASAQPVRSKEAREPSPCRWCSRSVLPEPAPDLKTTGDDALE